MKIDEKQYEKELKFLRDPKLISNVVKLVHDQGVKGNKEVILAIIATCAGKLVKNKNGYSTNLGIIDRSSSGKDFIISCCNKIIFSNHWDKEDMLSPTSITYKENMTEHTINYMRDASQDFFKSPDCKGLFEGNCNITRTMPDRKRKELWIPLMTNIFTTAQSFLGEEVTARSSIVYMNTTEKHIEEVQEWQNWSNTPEGIKVQKIDEKVKLADYAFRVLEKTLDRQIEDKIIFEPIEVAIPKEVRDYANKIVPKSNILDMQRLNAKFNDFIKFFTVLHYYQRVKDKDNLLIATKIDAAWASVIFNFMYRPKGANKIVLLTAMEKELRDNIMNNHKNPTEGITIKEMYKWNCVPSSLHSESVRYHLNKIQKADKGLQIQRTGKESYYYYTNVVEIDTKVKEISDKNGDNIGYFDFES